MYYQNYKIMKKIIRHWKCLQTRQNKRQNYVNCLRNSNFLNDCTSQINLQVQWSPCQQANVIFLRTGLINFQIYKEPKNIPNVSSMFWKKNKAEDIAFHGLKLCYKVLIIKMVKYLHKNRHVKRLIRIESSCLYPPMYCWVLGLLPNIGYCK